MSLLSPHYVPGEPPVGRGLERQRSKNVNSAFLDYYRCPEVFADFRLTGELLERSEHFQLGPDRVCYGQHSSYLRDKNRKDDVYDALADIRVEGTAIYLPFNLTNIIDNLRHERYVGNSRRDWKSLATGTSLRDFYYLLRPLIPASARRRIKKVYHSGWDKIRFPSWPVDLTVERLLEELLARSLQSHGAKIPFIWFWPDGLPSCAIVTHDVETSAGKEFCSRLMDIDDSFGIKASFQIVPEDRYPVSEAFLDDIRRRGFEVNIHDLNHDGRLFRSRKLFLKRAEQINRYAAEYGALGFRSAVLYRKADWYDALDFSYDMSFPNVSHLEPQPGGCCTVMPYFIGKMLELPVTTTQDYSLFHILEDYSIDLWKQQIGLIRQKHGLVSFIVHPDYILQERPRNTYLSLLKYLSELSSAHRIWTALPKDVNTWWRQRSQMRLTWDGNRWGIDGPGKERARIGYAELDGGRVKYTIEPAAG